MNYCAKFHIYKKLWCVAQKKLSVFWYLGAIKFYLFMLSELKQYTCQVFSDMKKVFI